MNWSRCPCQYSYFEYCHNDKIKLVDGIKLELKLSKQSCKIKDWKIIFKSSLVILHVYLRRNNFKRFILFSVFVQSLHICNYSIGSEFLLKTWKSIPSSLVVKWNNSPIFWGLLSCNKIHTFLNQRIILTTIAILDVLPKLKLTVAISKL